MDDLLGLETDRAGRCDLGSTIRPEQRSVLDTVHDILLRDQLAIERVEDDSWTRNSDDVVGWSWDTLLGVVKVLVSVAVRLGGRETSGCQVDELVLHCWTFCDFIVAISIIGLSRECAADGEVSVVEQFPKEWIAAKCH